MTNIVKVFLFTMTLLQTFEVCAQSYSSEYRISGTATNSVIMRNTTTGDIFMHFRDAAFGGCFMYTVPGNSTGSVLKFVPTTTIDGSETIIVKDMKIGNGKCYFCGLRFLSSIDEEIGGPFGRSISNNHDSVGIVGVIPLSQFQNPDITPGYSLIEIPGVKELTKMEMRCRMGSVQLMMIGEPEDRTSTMPSCIVDFIQYLSSSTVEYEVWVSPDPKEVFTDIALSASYLNVVSRLQDSNWSFALRKVQPSYPPTGISHFPYSVMDPRVSFNMQSISLPMHEADAPIRMAVIPGTDSLFVAYECRPSNGLGHYKTVLHKMDMYGGPVMTNTRLVDGHYDIPGTFKDIAYIPFDKSVVLLQSYDDPMLNDTYLRFFSWGGGNACRTLRSPDYLANSLSVYNNRYVYSGAYDKISKEVMYLTQDKNYAHLRTLVCRITESTPSSENEIVYPVHVKSGMVKIVDKEDVQWSRLNTTLITMDIQEDCNISID